MKKAELEVLVQEALTEAGKEVNKKEATLITDTVFQVVFDAIVAGEEVPVGKIGKLTSAERAARKGRNPQDGSEIEIAASTVAKFKPSKAIKDALKNK